MKTVSIAIISLLFFLFQELPNVRENYQNAAKSQKQSEDFYNLMENYSNDNQTLMAYKGAAFTIKAKFAKPLSEKKSLFTQGAKLVDDAVKNDPNNIEVRMIRLSIQENSPKILKYKKNIEEDKVALLTKYDKQTQSLKEYLKKYIIQSDAFSDQEKNSIAK